MDSGAEIGWFSFFPADQTGDYHLSVTPEEQAALLSGDPSCTLPSTCRGLLLKDIEVELTPVFLD